MSVPQLDAPPHHTLRARLFAVLHRPEPGNRWARQVNILLAVLILANAATVTLESVPGLNQRLALTLWWFEAVSTGVFIVEYLARVWVCVEQHHLARPVQGRLRYMLQPLPLLDLIAVLTYWTPWDLRFLRVMRLVRLLKVLRLYEFEAALDRFAASMQRRRELLIVAVTLMAVCVYLSASLLYQVEHGRQPQVFTSIPATFWWALVTFTTIGYGDMTPITGLGQVCAGLMAVFGIGLFALPAAIVTAAIIEASAHDAPYICEQCGHHGRHGAHHGG